MTLADILVILQIVTSAAPALFGSLAEAYGYSLALGTSWPYQRGILRLAQAGDLEAWHLIIATTLGANALILAALVRDANAISSLALSVGSALLGFATLRVLAGRTPAFFHGLHETHGMLCAYVFEVLPSSP
jgi:hypothetical protein